MDIFTVPSINAGSVRWQETPGQWTLTVVVKVTFALEEGISVIVDAQEAIHEQDSHREDDLEGGLYAPCDLVPYKMTPEVVLVGSVFAPHALAGHPVTARLTIGTVDKAVEIAGQGGPTPAVGFGPLPARWPERADRLGPVAITPGASPQIDVPLGMDLDGTYFQSSPEDQRLPGIRPDESLVLEHLHPRIEHLMTSLPGIRPRTRIELEGMPPWELDLTADTLWIDTNRSIGTLTWRGQLPLDGRDQPGRIFIGVESPGEGVEFPEVTVQTRRRPPVAPAPDDADDVEATQTNGDSLERTGLQAVPFATAPALPFGARPVPGKVVPPSALPFAPRPAAAPPVAVPPAVPSPRPRPAPADLNQTGAFPGPTTRGRMPTWLGGMIVDAATGAGGLATAAPAPSPSQARAPVPPPSPSQARASVPAPPPSQVGVPVPPPPVAQILRVADPVPVSLTAASNRAAGLDEAAPMGGPPALSAMAPLSAIPVPPPPVPGTIQPVFAPAAMMPSGMALHPAPPLAARGTVGQATVGQATVAAAATVPRSSPPPRPSQEGLSAPPDEHPRPRRSDPRALATAAFLGAAEASTAAAIAREDAAARAPAKKDKAAPAQAAAPSPARTVIDFLWFSPELPPRLDENEAWKRLLAAKEPPPAPAEEAIADEDLPPDAPPRKKRKPPEKPEKTPEEKAKDDRARVTRVLSRAEPALDVEGALFSAVNDDDVIEPPLLAVAGDLELPFDEVETLRVLTSAANPLAVGDKKLKETLDLANEALATPLGSSPEVAASFSLRVRDAWIRANRILPPDYLDVHTRRVLLEQRRYQMRDLLGAQWIRALVHTASGERPAPAYLPAELAKKLPLFVRFPARLVVEALPAQDQNEGHPVALRVLALARAVTGRTRR